MSDDISESKCGLMTEQAAYKPFRYPWAYEAWMTQQRVHWLPEEVPMADDIKDWAQKLTVNEKNLATQILRFFTNADIEVAGAYMKYYSQIFKPTEILMMFACFGNIESVHISAYSHLLDSLGLPEIEYSAFTQYKEMIDKQDFFRSFNMNSKRDIAKTMAAFGSFTEGLQLFASFAILMNFPRFNKLKGVGQIVTWSVRDESIHCLAMARMFRTFIEENPELWTEDFQQEIVDICKVVVTNEDAFVDLAFEMGAVEGLSADEVKQYIRFIADRRLAQIGLQPIYHVQNNPLPWMDDMLNAIEHTNFFENRATEYSKSATQGSWEDAFIDAMDTAI